MQALARTHTKEAFETLVQGDEGQPWSVRIQAADKILDRGWGKPAQAVQHDGHKGYTLE